MTQEVFEEKLNKIKEQENEYNVKINITDIHDKDHLDCLWYGGEVGSIETSDNWKIIISACGENRFHIKDESMEIIFSDKGYGEAYNEFGQFMDDDKFRKLIEEEKIRFGDNNWFEVDLIDPNGNFIDLFEADNLLGDDLLECFEDVSKYFKYIDWAKECAKEEKNKE